MSALKEKLAAKIAEAQSDVREIVAAHGDRPLSQVSVAQAYGGMRGVKCMVTETSAVDPQEGIRYRGYSIPQLRELLPKVHNGAEPLPEGVFYLLLTGEIPTADEVAEITATWRADEEVPGYATAAIDRMPRETHPMTQLSMGILGMQPGSIFARRYREGMAKTEHWEAMFDDSMRLLAKMPPLAAYIYRRTYHDGRHLPAAKKKVDWAANLSHMMGVEKPEFQEMLRLYLSALADHEGGNVSAHATHLVGSALSDPYYALSAGINGLAGPLHGLANQEVMRWILSVKEKLGGGVPTNKQLSEFLWETLNSGQVVPGYGHGVLRATDPRYMAQRQFALKHCPDDENVKIVEMLFELVPDILKKHGKAKNPWPNVDAYTGSLLVHYGVTEYDFYTVLFGVSRSIGVLASLVWDRALALPLERPKSVTSKWIREEMAKD
jgi:citrate synthase